METKCDMSRDPLGTPGQPEGNVSASPVSTDAEIQGDDRYRLLFAGMLNGFALCEVIPDSLGGAADCRFQEVNPAFERITGFSGAEIIGKSFRELFPDMAAACLETCVSVALTGEAASFMMYFATKDKHFDVSVFSPARGLIAATFDDVSRRVAVEQTLRESESREKARAAELAALMEAVPATVLIAHDTDCKLITGNLVAYELLRMPQGGNLSKSAPDSERPMHYSIFRDGEETPIDMLPMQRAARGEEVRGYEQEFVFDDGSSRTLLGNATPLRDEDGILWGAVSTFVDITERKKMERALAESEELFHTLCEAAPIGIFRADVNGGINYLNPVWEQISGKKVEDSLGQGWREGIYPDDWQGFRDAWTEALNADGSLDFEYRMLTPGGKTVWVRILARPMKDKDGRISGYIGTIEDITTRHQASQEMLKSQKLESIGVLAGGIAHDFNNILTTIMGNVSLARMQLHDPEKLTKRLTELENAALRAKELSQQLLTFARGGEPVKKSLDIGTLVRDATVFSLHGSSVMCEFAIDSDLPPVDADEGQLSQVVHNLVINAVQSMPNGGRVVVAVKREGPVADGRTGIEISVADSGTGISEQYLERIFDPYFTTKQQGSGLGLATSYSIVRKHGGSIRVESKLGQGSTFFVTLPAAVVPAAASAAADPGVCGEAVRVLVLDDEDQVREILHDMLEELGFQSDCVGDGIDAVALYRERREEGRPFSAVILDLTIPGGMGGKDAIRSLLEIDPEVNAIVSSGYSTDPIMANFRDYGFRAVLSKPYRLNDMERVFKELLSPGHA